MISMKGKENRNKKTVDYSQFLDLDNDDEDFASSAPLSKKARVETKKEKPKRKIQKEETTSPKNSQGKRLPLDVKLYQRDLEVALALSVQQTSAVVENNETAPRNEAAAFTVENNTEPVSFSNCCVDSSVIGLDEITESNEQSAAGRSRRQAASKAITEQRKLLSDDSGGEEEADDFRPDAAVYADSESDSSFSGEDEEEEFEVKKPKKAPTKKVIKENTRSVKKEKHVPKTVSTPMSTPVTIKIKPMAAKKAPVTPPAPPKHIVHSSTPVGMKRPAWTPPASSGKVSSPLTGGTVRSPNQGLRLGLSRLARVKPLHPDAIIH